MIRPATPEDLGQLVEWARQLHETHEPRFPFDPEHTAAFLSNLTAFVAPQGFIAGAIIPAPQNNRWRTAFEVFLWGGGDGPALIAAFEEWARDQGANEIEFSHPTGVERLSRHLIRRGYRASKACLTKEF